MNQVNINRQSFQTVSAALNNGKDLNSQRHLLTDFSKINLGNALKSKPQSVPQLSSKTQVQMLQLQTSVSDANKRYHIQQALLDKMIKKNDSRKLTIHWLKNRILRLFLAMDNVTGMLEGVLQLEMDVYYEYAASHLSTISSPRGKENAPLSECDASGIRDMWQAYGEVDSKLRKQDYEYKRSSLKDESLELAKKQACLTKLYQLMTRLAKMRDTDLSAGEFQVRFHFVSNTGDTSPQSSRRLRARHSDTPETIIKQLPRHWQVSMQSKFIHPATLPKFNTPSKEIGDMKGWVGYFEAGGVVLVVGEMRESPLHVEK